jgi:RimJ/RimL family protein N-acetyltransferase
VISDAEPPARTTHVALRPVTDADVPLFYEHQLDAQARQMAAFTSADPADRAAFDAHWARIRANPEGRIATIEADGAVAGYILAYRRDGQLNLGYWIARAAWGRGIATAALTAFLDGISEWPVYAAAASDNAASIRVLEKCGFTAIATETAFANGRGAQIDETIFTRQ